MKKRTDSMQARLMRAEVSGIRVTELPSPPGRVAVAYSAAGRQLNSPQPCQPVSLGWSSRNPYPRSRDVRLTSFRAG